MPSPRLVLRIPTPCSASWAAMTPTGSGRHCAACQKTVVDFTTKTDAEILAYLAHAGSAPCGRFRAAQLARPLQPAATASRWRSWLASVLAVGGVLGSGRAAAQAGNYFSAGPTPTVLSPAAPALAPTPPARPQATPAPAGLGGPAVVRGVVTDATTGDRLPGVTVLLKGTAQGASTNANGEFSVEIPSAALATLVVSSVGYERQEIVVGTEPLAILLTVDKQVLGEMGIVVVGSYATRPYPWHPRAFYSWSKYWLTRPFRR